MLYVDRKVLDVVGGMDTYYYRWGREHGDWSNRIFNAGLTSFRYQDVPNSDKLIYSGDEHESVVTTVDQKERVSYLKEVESYYQSSFTSKRYCQYISADSQGDRDEIITCYFTNTPDPQRQNKKWTPVYDDILPLINSTKDHNLTILHDCFDKQDSKNIKHVRVDTSINPYFQRWVSYYQYLLSNPDLRFVWFVDATDVDMLNVPFDEMLSGKLYVGDEPDTLANKWLAANHRLPYLLRYFRFNRSKTLLNAGVMGGDYQTVKEFIQQMLALYFDSMCKAGNTDMGLFNYIAYTKFGTRIVHGRRVTTVFKKYEQQSSAWFRHK